MVLFREGVKWIEFFRGKVRLGLLEEKGFVFSLVVWRLVFFWRVVIF